MGKLSEKIARASPAADRVSYDDVASVTGAPPSAIRAEDRPGARLAGFETPKRIILVDEFPTTVGGKILKYKLRQSLSEER